MTGIKYTKEQLIRRWREIAELLKTASVEVFIELVKERYRLIDLAERMGVDLPFD
jgi:hypothetical protein